MTNNNTEPIKNLYLKRVLTYWLSFAVGYVFPFVYFFITAGIKQQASKWVIPTLIAGIILVVKLATDIPKWTESWRPTFWKGLLLGLPKIILFMILLSLGGVLQWVLKKQIEVAMYTYFETVLVLFGGQAVGAIIYAFHLKYKQLDLIEKGYVLGVVNR